jgi:hypothetical protein
MLGWAWCGFHKKLLRTSYVEHVFLHHVGSAGHVVYSGVFASRQYLHLHAKSTCHYSSIASIVPLFCKFPLTELPTCVSPANGDCPPPAHKLVLHHLRCCLCMIRHPCLTSIEYLPSPILHLICYHVSAIISTHPDSISHCFSK